MSPRGFAVVLPARYASTRFPGKPLAAVSGRPLIEWVYRAAERIQGAERVVVATDSRRIAEVVADFGGDAVLTSPRHRTGTDRVAEVARTLDYECIVNLQGDEPIIPPGLVERMVSLITRASDVDVVTPCHPLLRREDLENPNNVKVVMDPAGKALYFSRSPIPYGAFDHVGDSGSSSPYRHIGIYAFRRSSLLEFASLPQSPLEKREGLEQLRALENGMVIRLVISPEPTVGVDVPSDVKIVEKEVAHHYTSALETSKAKRRDEPAEP